MQVYLYLKSPLDEINRSVDNLFSTLVDVAKLLSKLVTPNCIPTEK